MDKQRAISKLAATFKAKAAALVESGKPEATLFHGNEGHTFLMSTIQKFLEKEVWDDDDAAKLAATFFFLLTCDETDDEDEDEDDDGGLL